MLLFAFLNPMDNVIFLFDRWKDWAKKIKKWEKSIIKIVYLYICICTGQMQSTGELVFGEIIKISIVGKWFSHMRIEDHHV